MSNEVRLAIQGKHHSPLFHRIPFEVRDGQESIFDPWKIPIGPYHHQDTSCKALQQDKDQCFQRVCQKYGKQFNDFEKALPEKIDDLMKEYDHLPGWAKWLDGKNKILKMMIVDACYILEIMREVRREVPQDSHVIQLFKNEDMEIYRHDLLLYENQIPLTVLQSVASVQDPKKPLKEICEYLLQLTLDFFSLPRFSGFSSSECLHILDIYRHGLLGRLEAPRDKPLDFNIPSATELKEARIGILKSGSSSLMGISFCEERTSSVMEKIFFCEKRLSLPQVKLCDVTKSNFHNLVWFERLGGGCKNKQFSSYVSFMSSLIKCPADSAYLRECEVIRTTGWHDAAVKEMFHQLRENSEFDPDKHMDYKLLMVGKEVRKRYDRNTQEWRKDLFQNYLKTPWAITGLIAAVFIFSLTVIQTIYTVLGYYKSEVKCLSENN